MLDRRSREKGVKKQIKNFTGALAPLNTITTKIERKSMGTGENHVTMTPMMLMLAMWEVEGVGVGIRDERWRRGRT